MRHFLRAMFAFTVATLLAVALATPSDAQYYRRGGARSFDGAWSVAIYTAQGNCGSYRAAVSIVGGRVEGGGGQYSLSGSVSPSGAVSVTVSSGAGTAAGYGRLYGNSGGGRWRTSSGECAGSWTASRR